MSTRHKLRSAEKRDISWGNVPIRLSYKQVTDWGISLFDVTWPRSLWVLPFLMILEYIRRQTLLYCLKVIHGLGQWWPHVFLIEWLRISQQCAPPPFWWNGTNRYFKNTSRILSLQWFLLLLNTCTGKFSTSCPKYKSKRHYFVCDVCFTFETFAELWTSK